MKVVSTERVPIKMWLNEIEDGALEQAKNLANLPFIFKHVAIMPDSHQGYGMPIGGVIATKGAIIPNAVGVDIGCGMSAFNTGISSFTTSDLKNIMGEIRKNIPVGMKWRDVPCERNEMPSFPNTFHQIELPICSREFDSAQKQLGTLGGGNHFIELQKDEKGCLWVMIHSGSRNLGKQVADHYNKVAIALNEKYFSQVLKEWQLAFLPEGSNEAKNYLAEMNFCLDFAYKNREKMMREILTIISAENSSRHQTDAFVRQGSMINIHHNFASLENHFGQNVWVHRKGATSAREGQIGIIPGSQGTKSYIVRGLGNHDSFTSCSHGAGRKMSRSAAEKELSLEEQKKLMDDQGIIHGIRNVSDLDEAPGAYKDIYDVMNNQKDLVEIVTELTPLAVIKG